MYLMVKHGEVVALGSIIYKLTHRLDYLLPDPYHLPLRPIHATAHTEVGIWFRIENGGLDGHQLLRSIEKRERSGQLHRQINGFLQQGHIVMTVEHEPVGIVIVQEQDQFEVSRILVEVVCYLTS